MGKQSDKKTFSVDNILTVLDCEGLSAINITFFEDNNYCAIIIMGENKLLWTSLSIV